MGPNHITPYPRSSSGTERISTRERRGDQGPAEGPADRAYEVDAGVTGRFDAEPTGGVDPLGSGAVSTAVMAPLAVPTTMRVNGDRHQRGHLAADE